MWTGAAQLSSTEPRSGVTSSDRTAEANDRAVSLATTDQALAPRSLIARTLNW